MTDTRYGSYDATPQHMRMQFDGDDFMSFLLGLGVILFIIYIFRTYFI